MKLTRQDYTNVAADTDGLADATICTGAGPWVPNISASVGDGLAHLITITQAGGTNHSTKTAIITGTNANGQPQTETGLALPNGAATVTSSKYFLTVSSVAISATIGGDTMTMGWAANAVSPWTRAGSDADNHVRGGFALGIGCTVASGSPSYTVQYTYDEIGVFNHATIATQTVSLASTLTAPVGGLRLLFTVAGRVIMTLLQA